jgi:hypothetical protein
VLVIGRIACLKIVQPITIAPDMGGIAADYVLPGGTYLICEVSETFRWSGKNPGLIWADCWSLEEAQDRLRRMTSSSIWMDGREGVVLGIWDGMRWV